MGLCCRVARVVLYGLLLTTRVFVLQGLWGEATGLIVFWGSCWGFDFASGIWGCVQLLACCLMFGPRCLQDDLGEMCMFGCPR